jgi:hypothetical protein
MLKDFVTRDRAVDDDVTDANSILGIFLRHGLRERPKPGPRGIERAISAGV